MMFGEEYTDKTLLINKYLYTINDEGDIGVNFYVKRVMFKNKKIKLQIWDLEVEGRFIFLLGQYSKGANGALILFDITNRCTLDRLSEWVQVLRRHAGDIPIMLIGTKLELAPHRVITKEECIDIAENYKLSAYAEISAKTGQNIEKMFGLMTELLLETINM